MKSFRSYSPPSLDGDPAPNIPTLEEIELAEELRHRLELKFLSPADLYAERFGQDYGWAANDA